MADKCFDAQEMRENCVKETFVLLSFSIEKQEMEFEISELVRWCEGMADDRP